MSVTLYALYRAHSSGASCGCVMVRGSFFVGLRGMLNSFISRVPSASFCVGTLRTAATLASAPG